MHSNRNHPKPLAAVTAVMSSKPHTAVSRLRSQWPPCFIDCLLSSPLIFKGINGQLVNCRADRGCAQLSNSLRLLNMLLCYPFQRCQWHTPAGTAQGWKSGDISFASRLQHNLGEPLQLIQLLFLLLHFGDSVFDENINLGQT